MIFLTFVGNHDTIDNLQNGPGAVLTIFLQYKEIIEDVYIFVTPSKPTDRINYHQVAEQNKARMLAEKAGLNVELIPMDLSNPIDFDLVYPKLLREVQQVLNRGENRNKEKIINITSGTPTMTTCWVLLHKSRVISNAQLVQSFETRFARERGKSTQEVNLEIDDFPQITVPEELRLQLNIANREKDELTERLATSELDRKIPELIGCSPQIRDIKDIILHELDKESHVLIVGERGTGKQEVAEAIWRIHRTNESMETFNCGAWNAELIISELFGHRKGAFTGATQDKTGIIKKSNGQLLEACLNRLKNSRHWSGIKSILLRKETVKGHWQCPCGSKKRFRDCHSDALQGIWHLQRDLNKYPTAKRKTVKGYRALPLPLSLSSSVGRKPLP